MTSTSAPPPARGGGASYLAALIYAGHQMHATFLACPTTRALCPAPPAWATQQFQLFTTNPAFSPAAAAAAAASHSRSR